MIEIGSKKQRVVKRRVKGKLVPVIGPDGQPETKVVASEVIRVTHSELGGHFGRDKRRKLVVALRSGDVLELRPQGTRQVSSMLLTDVYSYMLRCAAARRQLEKARKRKVDLAVKRENAKIKRMERRLRRSI
jgi:hypothetical protein